MLVLANGAFKSGSTWLYNILRCITSFPAPPEGFLNAEWVNPSIHPNKLAHFLSSSDLSTENYLCKNHLYKKIERDLLLSYPNVLILDIHRDLKDVVVSAYHHWRRTEGYTADFKTYYWTRGRLVANHVRRGHYLWSSANSPQVYVSSYERLKANFQTEVQAIGQFLGFELSTTDIERIQAETTLERLREKYSEAEKAGELPPPCGATSDDIKFFRKGIVGDWQNHMTPEMVADIEHIEARGLNLVERGTTKLFAFAARK